MDDSLLTRYSRHIMLDDLGIAGQEALSAAHVLLIGLGGLGSPAALYLAAAGVGRLTVCDDDAVELTNLQRQIIHLTDTVGEKKTDSACRHLMRINPHVTVSPVCARVEAENIDALVDAADIIVDGSDNYATRHLVNRASVRHRKPLVFGAAVGFDGQLSVFDPRRDDSPCYNCLFAETDEAPDVRCALLGVLAPLAGVVGCLQAAEVIKCVAMPAAKNLVGRLVLIDGRDARWREVKIGRDPECAVCHAR